MNGVKEIIASPLASPSNPSLKLIAFALPIRTAKKNGMNKKAVFTKLFTNGKYRHYKKSNEI